MDIAPRTISLRQARQRVGDVHGASDILLLHCPHSLREVDPPLTRKGLHGCIGNPLQATRPLKTLQAVSEDLGNTTARLGNICRVRGGRTALRSRALREGKRLQDGIRPVARRNSGSNKRRGKSLIPPLAPLKQGVLLVNAIVVRHQNPPIRPSYIGFIPPAVRNGLEYVLVVGVVA